MTKQMAFNKLCSACIYLNYTKRYEASEIIHKLTLEMIRNHPNSEPSLLNDDYDAYHQSVVDRWKYIFITHKLDV